MNKSIGIFLFSLFLLTNVSLAQKTIENIPENNPKFSVTVGTQVCVNLPSNPSTGYIWYLSSISDSNIVCKLDSKYIAKVNKIKNSHPMAGVPGQEKWTFKALKKGRVTIKMHYARNWEAVDASTLKKTYTVNVK